jgi:hypothetical protein
VAQFKPVHPDSLTAADTLESAVNIPIFSTGGEDAESSIDPQEVSSLLQSSKDVFVQFAGFQFGMANYRIRGYQGENQTIMINGVTVNNPETGIASWSSWGGLNDVTRNVETRFGTVANRYGFSGCGGYTNIDSKASGFKKGTRVSYSSSNRIYRHRLMLTHSTGFMKNDWAITFSASSRVGNEVYVRGTYFNARAFYFSADKRINEKHLLNFTGFFAPVEQGRTKAATKELYELTGSNYYNSNWGYQNGKIRNASVNKTSRPMLMFSHIYNPRKDARLTTTLCYNFGRLTRSGLNWNDASNTRPDYYKRLPSYYYLKGDTLNGDLQTSQWDNTDFQQINWDEMIAMNQANLYTSPSLLGQGTNTTETRARYILEKQVESLNSVVINSTYNARFKKIFVSLGLKGNFSATRKFKEIEDLLGASFWLDVDQFAEGLGVEESIRQNDIDNPNRKVKAGDRFGYDYTTYTQREETWGQVEYNQRKVDVYLGVTLSHSGIWRVGHVANGKFPDNSKGKGPQINFINSGTKAGMSYKISGKQYLNLNTSFFTRTPEVNNIYISPKVRQDFVNGIKNESVLSGDINYIVNASSVKFRFTYYHTEIRNQLWLRTYWSDEFNNNINVIMKNLDEIHDGVEMGIEKILFDSHSLQAAIGYGVFVYSGRPTLEAWQDNNSQSLFNNRTVYLNNYRVGGTPQTAIGAGYKYTGRKSWFVGLYANYLANNYVEANPDRRTGEIMEKFQVNENNLANNIIKQEKLPSFYIVNLNGGKSIRIKKKYFLNLNISINNLLNNKNIPLSGTESLRWNPSMPDLFANKYYYMTGTTYMIIVNLSF